MHWTIHPGYFNKITTKIVEEHILKVIDARYRENQLLKCFLKCN